MATCGGFWFWFMRPFAEFLGGLALLACIVGPFFLLYLFLGWSAKRGKAKQ